MSDTNKINAATLRQAFGRWRIVRELMTRIGLADATMHALKRKR